jgi:major membrane immunogen (membrane-anchored lipoprotein)
MKIVIFKLADFTRRNLMKRMITLSLILAIAAVSLAFGQVKAKDGVYFAQDGGFASSGWKEQVVITVQGGKIVKAAWNGTSNIAGAADKRSYDAAGKYDMVKFGKAKAEWNAQAKAVEDYLVRTQDIGFNKYKDAEGRTDAISGASIHVKPFFELAGKALASAPVAKGMYSKDGWYYAEQAAFDAKSGWKDSVLVTVVNGSVVDVLWNGTYKDGTKKSKLVEAETGKYGMSAAAKKGEWNVQAKVIQDAIVKAQDPTKIPPKNDAISGASIFPTAVLLAAEALKAAK